MIMRKKTLVLSLALILFLVGGNASAEDKNSGYMNRMLMTLSGQEPPPLPEYENASADMEDAAQDESNVGSLLPVPSNDDDREPITRLELAQSGINDDASYSSRIEPASGDQAAGVKKTVEKLEPAPQGTHEEKPDTIETDTSYKLNIGDLLRVTVYGVTDLTNSYRVDSSGNLTVPLVGEMPARGRGKEELQAEIAKRLIDGGYYNSPSVTVEVIELAPFYILGEVNKPGRYPFEPGLDIVRAIATAGGYTPRAAKNKIYITRNVDGQKQEIKAEEGTELLPGDSIEVKQRFF